MGGRGANSSIRKKGNLGDGLTTDVPFYQVGTNRFFAGDVFTSNFNEGGDERDWNKYYVTGVSKNGIEVKLQDTGSMSRRNQIGTFMNMDSSSRALQKATITEQSSVSRQAYARARNDERRKLIKILNENNIKYRGTDLDYLRSVVSQNQKAGLIK